MRTSAGSSQRRGSQPFARRTRAGSLIERVTGKPSTKLARLAGMLLLLGLGGGLILPAAESGVALFEGLVSTHDFVIVTAYRGIW